VNFNKCFLAGNLTRDPECRFTPKGSAVCGFSIAVNRSWTTEGGEKKEDVNFFDIEAFGRSAENIAQYFRKGKPIFIEGRAKVDSWDDKTTGQKKSKVKFIVESWQFCGGDKGESAPRQATSAPAQAEGNPPDDDVPF